MRLIDADKLKEYFNMDEDCDNCQHDARDCRYKNEYSLMDFCSAIDDVPTVEPKKGKWISDSSNKLSEWAVCSACWFGTKRIDDDYNFCPNCGADMRDTEDEH